MLTPGSLLKNRYRIERLLDRSEFGDLYLARDQGTDRMVTVKVITREAPNLDQQFENDTATLFMLSHPAVPAVIEFFSESSVRFLVCEHPPGDNLEALRLGQAARRLAPRAAALVMLPVLEALVVAHGRTPPLLHRDIRPTNIYVSPEGLVTLRNFGIASLGQRETAHYGVTTPGFAPHEQQFGDSDARADLYAVGASLYVLLTGKLVPTATERDQLAVPDGVGVAPDLSAVVMRLLAPQREQRYESAAVVLRALIGLAVPQACPRCGSANRETARFCTTCKTPLAPSVPGTALLAALKEALPRSAPATVLLPNDAAAEQPAPNPQMAQTEPGRGVAPSAPTVGAPPLPTNQSGTARPTPPQRTTATLGTPTPPPQPKPFTPRVRPSNKLITIMAGGVAVLLLICGVGSFLLLQRASPGHTQTASGATTVTTQSTGTVAALSGSANGTPASATAVALVPTAAPTVAAPTAAPTTAAPTAAPTLAAPTSLVPTPGTLGLADFQAIERQYTPRQRTAAGETFDRGNRTKSIWLSGKENAVFGNTRAELVYNYLRFTLAPSSDQISTVWFIDRTEVKQLGNDYIVQLDVVFNTPNLNSSVGIAFDMQDGANSGSVFEIFNDQHWRLHTFRDGAVIPERTTERIPDAGIGAGTAVTNLWLVRTPSEVQIWIAAKQVAVFPASPFSGGFAGLAVTSFPGLASPAQLIVDNFRVRAR